MRDRRIPAPAPDAASRIDAHDVPVEQHAGAGDAVHHLVVHGDATGRGKRHLARHALEERDRIVLDEKTLDGGVDLGRGDPRPHECGRPLVRTPDDEPRAAHERDLAG
jgi:hypothetical protein